MNRIGTPIIGKGGYAPLSDCEIIPPTPQTKNDPIRWDFSQKEIERMKYLLSGAISICENDGEIDFANQLRIIESDWQRRIDWNIKHGNWK